MGEYQLPLINTRGDAELPVAMVMTGPAFDAAKRANVVGIEADITAMTAIAEHAGKVVDHVLDPLPPQFIVVRDATGPRKYLTHFDTKPPRHEKSPATEMYLWADSLDKREGEERRFVRTAERIALIEMAHAIGAPALTEMTVFNWGDEVSLARDFAAGLISGQRPVDNLIPRPAALSTAWRELRATLSGRTTAQNGMRNQIERLAKSQMLAPPFILHRG
jgi:hypothetical protein